MIAQCTTCGHTFETETWGVQTCPNCGTRVMLDPPPEDAGPGPGPEAPSGSAGTPPPFEAPDKGLLAGYLETVAKTLFHPSEIFPQLPVDDAGRAFLFAFITLTIAGEVGTLWSYLQMKAQAKTMASLSAGMPPEVARLFKEVSHFYGPSAFVLVPVSVIIGIFLFAGIVHLGVLLFGANNRGWNATFRATCYGSSPRLLALIPFCGSFVGLIWWLVLVIIAVMHTQRTTGGRAAGAVLVPSVAFLCCVSALLAFGLAAGGVAAAH